ncbi:MAG TPA: hypothetical protein VHQ47_05720 [Phycisphaerae bacterium]|jgi:hypothetical protein|nr:hypothetical protein [Phycisphaerae bacterium]
MAYAAMETGPSPAGRAWLRWTMVAAVAAVLLAIGIVQSRQKWAGVKGMTFIGHADSAAYALMGESLARGQGLQVRYVSWFFERYDAGVVRREDHWPPLMGMSIAPFFWMWGVSAPAARVPALMYGSIGLPLASAWVAYGVGRRGTGALLAGLLVMGNALVFEESLRTLSDVANAVMLCGWCGCLLMSREKKWMHVAAGVFLGLAYFAKGSEVMLLGLQAPVAVLVGGAAVLRRRWVWMGLATGVLVIAPYWWGNWRAYGNPLHSTQNYVSGYFGLEDWEAKTYFPYEGVDLPHTSDRWRKHGGWSGAYGELVRAQAGDAARLVMSGGVDQGETALAETWREGKGWVRFWMAVSVCGAATVLAALLWAGIWAVHKFRGKATRRTAMMGRVLAVAVVIGAHGAFLVLLWTVLPRFCIGMMALMAAVGSAGLVRAMEAGVAAGVAGWRRWRSGLWRWPSDEGRVRAGHWAALGACAAVILGSGLVVRAEENRIDVARWAQAEDKPQVPRMGAWIKEHLPTAVVMCRNPWELLFYCGPDNKAVGLPDPGGTPEEAAARIFEIARHYGVTLIYADRLRDCLRPYVRGAKKGLVREPGAPGALYRVDWAALDEPTAARRRKK